MKKSLIFFLALFIVLCTADVQAQARKQQTKRKAVKKHRVKSNRAAAKRTRAKRTKVVHYHYRSMPKRGAVVTSVHANAYSIKFGGVGYRFYNGIWYKPRGNSWVVTRPAIGVRVRILPTNHRRFVIANNTYFYYYGSYYIKKDNEYEVVEAPLNAEVDSLPDGYNTLSVDGQEYYELDDVYYMPSLNEKEEEVLVTVENPKK